MNDKQIMLIEDKPDDRDLTIRALKKHNVHNPVNVESNGAGALTLLPGDDHRDQDNPALILPDLKLPKVGGLEVLRADERTRVVPAAPDPALAPAGLGWYAAWVSAGFHGPAAYGA